MSKLSDRYFPEPGDLERYEDEGPDQEEPREASNLLSFVVLSLVIGIACGWAGILSGRI
jgi:hypothetical protein